MKRLFLSEKNSLKHFFFFLGGEQERIDNNKIITTIRLDRDRTI